MTRDSFYMNLRAFNRQMFNPTCVRHNHFQGHIATAKNCGTHWIKYMLSLALMEKYNLPPPAHIRDDAIVGHAKTPPVHKHIPQVAVTHSHPHYLMRLPVAHKILGLPKFVVLVRDIPAILVSMYEKSRGAHLDKKMGMKNADFSTYLRGDVTGRTRIEDIWGLILFFNAWGAAADKNPDRILTVRYEDLGADTLSILKKISDHMELELEEGLLARAIEKSSKKEMKSKIDRSEDQAERSVNLERREALEWYSLADLEFLRAALKKHLKHSFGYRY